MKIKYVHCNNKTTGTLSLLRKVLSFPGVIDCNVDKLTINL